MIVTITNTSGAALTHLPFPVNGSLAAGASKVANVSITNYIEGISQGNTAFRDFEALVKKGDVTMVWTPDPREPEVDPISILVANDGGAGVDARVVFVRKDGYTANGGAEGSLRYPFSTVQEAVDFVAANMAPTILSPVVIDIGPGVFAEAVVVQDTGATIAGVIFRGAGMYVTAIAPAAGVGLRVTNSTDAGLAAMDAGGGYAALVNDGGAGPQGIYLKDLSITGGGAGNAALEALGVDEGAGTTTHLAQGLHILGGVRLTPGAGGNALYARNSGAVALHEGNDLNGAVELRQVATIRQHNVRFGDAFTLGYDAADPQGQFAGGFALFHSDRGRFSGKVQIDAGISGTMVEPAFAGELELNGDANIIADKAQVVGDVDLNGTATLRSRGGYVEGNVDAEAGATCALRSTPVYGDLTLAAGAGTAELFASPVNGTITDAGNKIAYDWFDGPNDARDAALLKPAVGFLNNGVATGITAGGGVDIEVNGQNLLQGQTFASVTIGASLELIACVPGTGGNDYSVEVIDTGGGGLSMTWIANVLTIDQGASGSDEDTIATAINTVATSPVATIIRANSGGGGAVAVTALTALTGGTGRGFSASINGVDIPILHDNGAATSTANLTETLCTLNPPDLTGVAPAMAANDDVCLVIVSNGHTLPAICSTLV